jgi:hypothetical protein
MPAKKEAAMPQEIAPTPFLSAEDIDAADDLPEIEVQVPEWGGKVKVRGLSYDALAHARQQSYDAQKRETNEDKLNAWCLALGLVEPRITAPRAEKWIMERRFGPVNAILAEILTATGLGARAVEAAKSPSSEG